MKITLIGGGNGISEVALGLLQYCPELINPEDISLITPITDTGRSTGVARKIFQIPAPGDTRNSILKLASNKEIATLLQRRIFPKDDNYKFLDGMSLGNLALGTLVEENGGIVEAAEKFARMVDCKSNFIPVSNEVVDIVALTEDGKEHFGEYDVRQPNKPRIEKIFLTKKEAKIHPKVEIALSEAELIIIGPGCLYTSISSTLLFKGMGEALNKSKAKKIYICNSTTQPGQTDGFTCLDHLEVVMQYSGITQLDFAFFNDRLNISESNLEKFSLLKVYPIVPSDEEKQKIYSLVKKPFFGDLLESGEENRNLWDKVDTLRHDKEKLSKAIIESVGEDYF